MQLPQIGQSGGPDVVLRLTTYREGRLVLNDIEPGLPLRLRIHGAFGTLLQEQDIAPLGPGEQRSMQVMLERAPLTMRGRILNEAGDPLPRASVGVTWAEPDRPPTSSRSLSRSLEEDASFEFHDIYSDTVAFYANADGYVSFKDDNFVVPVDGSPVEIRLAAAQVVTVRIEDEDGQGVPGRVYADLASGNTLRGKEAQDQVGTYIVRGLPSSEVTIRARVHGVFYTRRHDPLIPELRIEVPRLGKVQASLQRPADLELDEWCHVWLFPRGDSTLVPRFGKIDLNGDGSAFMPDVLPGAYDVTVRRFLQGDYPPDAWFEEIEASFFEELATRIPIVVMQGETTEVQVRL